MKKFLLMFLVVIISLGGVMAQKADNKGKDKDKVENKGKGGEKGGMNDIPNMTPEQKTKIDELKNSFNTEAKALREQRKAENKNLKALVKTDNPDMNTVNSTIDKINNLQAQIDKKKAETHIKIRALLTPEQKKALDEKHDKMKDKNEDND